jgi:hypothetical protein
MRRLLGKKERYGNYWEKREIGSPLGKRKDTETTGKKGK